MKFYIVYFNGCEGYERVSRKCFDYYIMRDYDYCLVCGSNLNYYKNNRLVGVCENYDWRAFA